MLIAGVIILGILNIYLGCIRDDRFSWFVAGFCFAIAFAMIVIQFY